MPQGRRFATQKEQAIAVLRVFTLTKPVCAVRIKVRKALLKTKERRGHPKQFKEDNIMPRRGNVPKRDVLPDPVYGSKVVAKLINQIMLDGNKATAQKIVYDAFDMMREKLGKEPIEIFNQAMANVMPVLEVKARRVGGANYQVPIEIRPERRQTLAIRWIVINTRKRSEREMSKKLAAELMDAFNNTGGSVKKKEDTHRMAEANKAFAHFRF